MALPLTLTSSDESPECPGRFGTYDLELTEENHLIFTVINDECTGRHRYDFADGPNTETSDYTWSRISQ